MELAQVQSRSSKCCEILINHGASVDIKDKYVSVISCSVITCYIIYFSEYDTST